MNYTKMMAGSSSPMINGKVVPDGKLSGGCGGLSLICILVDTLGVGILGQGGSERLKPTIFYVSPPRFLSWLSQMLPSNALPGPSSYLSLALLS